MSGNNHPLPRVVKVEFEAVGRDCYCIRYNYPALPDPGDHTKFSNLHLNRQAKLLGHVVRSLNDDPLREVSFEPDTAAKGCELPG